MSARKVVPILAILLIAGLLVAGCAKPEEPTVTPPTPAAKPTVVEPTAPTPPVTTAEKAVYFCTMHPDEISDKPGKCSKCNMDLVEGVYQCPMHPGQMSDKPGKCAICGMDLKLVPKKEAQEKAGATKAKGEAKAEEHPH